MCVLHMHVCTCVTPHVCRAGDTFRESVLCRRDWTRVIGSLLHLLPTHLDSPRCPNTIIQYLKSPCFIACECHKRCWGGINDTCADAFARKWLMPASNSERQDLWDWLAEAKMGGGGRQQVSCGKCSLWNQDPDIPTFLVKSLSLSWLFFFFLLLLVLFVFLWDKVSLCSPGSPGLTL